MVAGEMFILGTYWELGRLPKAWFRPWALVLGVSELIIGGCELGFEKSGPFCAQHSSRHDVQICQYNHGHIWMFVVKLCGIYVGNICKVLLMFQNFVMIQSEVTPFVCLFSSPTMATSFLLFIIQLLMWQFLGGDFEF